MSCRVEANADWSLFCPNEAPGLSDAWGQDFEELYLAYEAAGKARATIKAHNLWFAILTAQQETGTPYMMYKDSCNAKSNQQNLGTIKCSNLCSEIVEYSSPTETACCNLASIALPRFVTSLQGGRMMGSRSAGKRVFDFSRLADVVMAATVNLDRVIDINHYPVETAQRSNMRHRPVGLGVQGLADVFVLLGMPYASPDAAQLNKETFETIYFAALRASCDLAKAYGPYETYQGSPASKGLLQHDLWGVSAPTDRWDWETLRADIAQHGLRNSLLVAPMPTASTSQILGNTESFEPLTANIYVRRTLSGEFPVVNKHLVHDLMALGLWTPELRNQLIAANGSIQGIQCIPSDLKAIYKTVWEIKQRAIIDMAADRGAFIDQSQSMNIHMDSATVAKLSSLHFYAWKKGLKSSQYYLRTRAAADAIKFTVDQQMLKKEQACTLGGDCLSCGS